MTLHGYVMTQYIYQSAGSFCDSALTFFDAERFLKCHKGT